METLETGLAETGLDAEQTAAIIDGYEEGQLIALRLGLLVAAALVVVALFLVRRIPNVSFEELAASHAAEP